jgi:type IV pilus assembly protein PilN
LDVVADLTPANRMWLNALQQSGTTLKLTGVALDNATIAQYMIDLAKSAVFVSADLESSSQTEVAGMKLKAFTLNIGVGEAEAPEAQKQDQQKGKIN